MRILISSTSFCEYVIQQANALAKLGHKIMIMMPEHLISTTVGSKIELLLDQEVTWHSYDIKKRQKYHFYTDLLKVASSFSPDVFHMHQSGEVESLAMILRLIRLPLIVTLHDIFPHPGNDSKIKMRRRLIGKFQSNCADVILIHGESLQQLLKATQPSLAKKSLIIPHGTLSLFKYWENEPVEKEPLTCLFFGRMEKYRGLDNLLTISDILRESLPNIRIIVAGKGTELTKLKEQFKKSGVFEIHDSFIPDTKVNIFFRRASLLLLPYHEASQSGIAHMAISFGLPIVATNVGAIPELIMDGVHGKIVDKQDMTKFADEVRFLLMDNTRLLAMSKACKALADELDFSRLANRYVASYERAIGIKSRRIKLT